jgi:hypothetical protein
LGGRRGSDEPLDYNGGRNVGALDIDVGGETTNPVARSAAQFKTSYEKVYIINQTSKERELDKMRVDEVGLSRITAKPLGKQG